MFFLKTFGFFGRRFSKKGFCQETFEKGLEKNKKLFKKSIQKSISKNQGQKSSQKKLGQKAKPSPTKNRYKFQNNNARASGARPKNGAARSARRPIFGVVVLNFESVFWKGLQELLAQFFLVPFLASYVLLDFQFWFRQIKPHLASGTYKFWQMIDFAQPLPVTKFG